MYENSPVIFRKECHCHGCTCYNKVHKCTRRGGYVAMGKCQLEADGAAPRHTPSIWARNLKDLRERNNLSQADVAKVLHCSQVAYGMYELGKRKLPVERLIILAKYYHVSLDYLVGLA